MKHFPEDQYTKLDKYLRGLCVENVRFIEGGRDLETGIDCAGLIIAVYAHLGLSLEYDHRHDLPWLWYKSPRWGEELLHELKKSFEVKLAPCPSPRAGDLLLFRMEPGGPVSHTAFLLWDGFMVHGVNVNRGIAMSRFASKFWLPRYAGWAVAKEEVWG